jgi:DNA-formamidopyrimidine glycosylase
LPEGHSVHRFANQFQELFLNQPVTITSPQGRFSVSAGQISGQRLIRSYAVGKQMFLDFENDLTLRIHLGIYGKWRFHDLSKTQQVPQIIGEVRARFAAAGWVVDLRGPTVCEVVDNDAVRQVLKRLGPDPLNSNPKQRESERFITKVMASKVEIGKLLMNQEVISGIGNVYRCEILFRHEIEPHTPGNSLSREQLQSIWDDCVKLLRVGVRTGFMITRDELFTKRTSKDTRNWLYKREGQPCRRCGAEIKLELMQARKLYWCPSCQK